ncbi:hypothetical protein KSP39_PZI022117 [Platanthera zijinensis]|uniref:Uncharacterized protein n=1 Tax=Platanthera zijinensis TaxID=2320716 RepID=A0AAP0AYI5_9ASPA
MPAGEEGKNQTSSPRTLNGAWPATAPAPRCVCAPATHAGSFKCRLHRVNSHGHSAPAVPIARQAPVSASTTRTVEAL